MKKGFIALLILVLCAWVQFAYGAAGDVASIGGKAITAIASVDGKTNASILTIAGKPCSDGDSACADTTCTGFLWCQNAEGTGYDNSESWGETGTTNEDYTTVALRGTQSVSFADTSTMYLEFADQTNLYIFGRFYFADSTPTVDVPIMLGKNQATDVSKVYVAHTTGKLTCQNGTSAVEAATGLSSETTYYIWVRFKPATSAEADDAVVTTEVSTTRLRSNINADLGCTLSNGTNDSTVIDYIFIGGNASGGAGVVADQLLGKSSAIGDVCE